MRVYETATWTKQLARVDVGVRYKSTQIAALDSMCTARNSTHVIPFRVQIRPGVSLFEQIVYAATRAMVAGQLLPGDTFPSVRSLSKELKINPNTAAKIVAHLVSEGLLEMHPGIGTVVARLPASTARERTHLLDQQIEELVVEAKRLGIEHAEIQAALTSHWNKLRGDVKSTGTRKGDKDKP